MRKARATMHGAISIVNAIATGNGSSLGISLRVTAEAELGRGRGVRFLTGRNEDRLVNNIVRNTMPKEMIENNQVTIRVKSEIPIGYGLKSSSAVSNAVALACSRLARDDDIDDNAVLDAAVRASLDAKVSITGAYDDATACYFGGFTVTDNYSRRLIRREPAPDNLYAIIFLPRNTPRGDVHKLSALSDLFTDAFRLAEAGEYWKAMKLNGVLASAALSSRYAPIMAALERGALAAGISGNGPSVAVVAYEDEIEDIKSALSKFDGKIIISKVNNQKASVEIVNG
ncbi:shikimate kinase [Candidatus Nitrososphaera gargensis Ga9.2]|uniref:Shikimate kinase n=1 Tax=Nitrososphaera gargensis (strain Ga9.2) TaxID=1237085 RepID=K0IHZ8_NITGG|nr:shikimate kinase [Candidatus Nitrososphaera gargensis]AFU58563.1 shikimate kinase [Candidatus Nitrososphaera gargensis Ga9.2]